MTLDTRRQLLDPASELFADRGFSGGSIASIASELGLTKQALLHHFSTKEKLYGEVLAQIADELDTLKSDALAGSSDPQARIRAFLLAMAETSQQGTIRSRLIVRELLDNRDRARSAEVWYLRPFLEGLLAMIRAIPAWRDADDAEVLAVLYQLLGALNFYAVSGPTLRGIFGAERVQALDAVFPEAFETLIDNALTRR